ncbi:MAG: endonuclease/exonuclease/phosphatase family protein [Hyphomicrobiaceae bacterium]
MQSGNRLPPKRGRVVAAVAWSMMLAGGVVLWMTALRSLWPPLDVASPLLFHALALIGIAAATLLLRARRAFFLLSCLGVLAIAPSVMTLDAREGPASIALPWHRPASTRDGVPAVRVLSLNTGHANGDLDRLRRYILLARADIVVLSEFGPNKSELLRQLRRAFPYQAGCSETWACSQVLLSRLPFHRSGTRMPDLDGPPLVWAEFHFSNESTAKLTVFGTHIYRPSRRHAWHAAQLDGLARIMQRTEGSIVVAGDFNMTHLSRSFEEFSAGSGLRASSRTLASWPAWPLPLPQVQLDHVFVSPDVEVLDQRLGRLVGSDHLPIITSIRLPHAPTLIARSRVGQRSIQ